LSFKAQKGAFSQGVHHVLKDVSLDLFEGETLGIIGRNGCGKTSILRMMAGIIAPTTGSVTRARNTTTALLSLGLGFRKDLTGRDNAVLSGMLQGLSRRDAESHLEEIKVFSELGDSFDEPVKTYSSGMRSRLGFTTALITNVDILLVDEVLSVGDAHFKHKAQAALMDRITGKQTVVFVSHSDKQIKKLCDRAVWLNDAVVAAEGGTRSVVRKYRRYIAGLNR
ncbi:MAG: ATP-binding cassette domain-containing protein, partial [Hyphomicrobiales bacterium]